MRFERSFGCPQNFQKNQVSDSQGLLCVDWLYLLVNVTAFIKEHDKGHIQAL